MVDGREVVLAVGSGFLAFLVLGGLAFFGSLFGWATLTLLSLAGIAVIIGKVIGRL